MATSQAIRRLKRNASSTRDRSTEKLKVPPITKAQAVSVRQIRKALGKVISENDGLYQVVTERKAIIEAVVLEKVPFRAEMVKELITAALDGDLPVDERKIRRYAPAIDLLVLAEDADDLAAELDPIEKRVVRLTHTRKKLDPDAIDAKIRQRLRAVRKVYWKTGRYSHPATAAQINQLEMLIGRAGLAENLQDRMITVSELLSDQIEQLELVGSAVIGPVLDAAETSCPWQLDYEICYGIRKSIGMLRQIWDLLFYATNYSTVRISKVTLSEKNTEAWMTAEAQGKRGPPALRRKYQDLSEQRGQELHLYSKDGDLITKLFPIPGYAANPGRSDLAERVRIWKKA